MHVYLVGISLELQLGTSEVTENKDLVMGYHGK